VFLTKSTLICYIIFWVLFVPTTEEKRMSSQQSRNKAIEKENLLRSGRKQFLRMLDANEEIKKEEEIRRAKERKFISSVPELMKKSKQR